jgi:hypothetical protein
VTGQAPKVLVATLWQRRSERGNEYLSGFLGKARIVGFRGEPTADGTPTWDIYLQPGKEQDERAGGRAQESPNSPRQSPDRSSDTQSPRVTRRPLHGNPIDDIGRS